MKKQNLNKLAFKKNVISDLQKKSVQGGNYDNLPSVKPDVLGCRSSVHNDNCIFACH
ncbi:hypothetical protein [Aquimarina spongiae]|uniref:Uncharacterized protein n=1 Tax=Aquimarina spongiae TaxID=570521 RepID=A0A1M6HLH9_9FLAO|nr:hypothetical protein [Aquimarina spongiae]SHJ23046.1 hypothetical protein SAMN04488508_106346 [Aquimarina spongiae]